MSVDFERVKLLLEVAQLANHNDWPKIQPLVSRARVELDKLVEAVVKEDVAEAAKAKAEAERVAAEKAKADAAKAPMASQAGDPRPTGTIPPDPIYPRPDPERRV